MKKILTTLCTLAILFSVFAKTTAAADKSVYLTIKPSYSARAVAPKTPGEINIIIQVYAPVIERVKERDPVAVALVIDASGSMSDAKKLDYAIRAGKTLVNSLGPKDQLAIYSYDSSVTEHIPLTPVKDKQKFIRLLENIESGGYTNLSGGLESGIKTLATSTFKGTRRVILLSDGLANRGVTEGEAVAAIAARKRPNGISVSSIGLGLDYDEALMQLLAQRGGGQYYYVKDSEDLPGVFREELSLTTDLVTYRTSAKFISAKSVKNIEIYGYPTKKEDDGTTIELSDFSSGEVRQILLTVEADTASTGELDLGTLNLAFARKEGGQMEEVSVPLRVAVVGDEKKREELNKEEEKSIKYVQDEVLLVKADQAQVEAMKELKAGNRAKAEEILTDNYAALAAVSPDNVAAEQKRTELKNIGDNLDAVAADAARQEHMLKRSKATAYKSAQGKKDGYMLQSSDKGFMVEKLQRALKEKGFYKGDVNGDYDSATMEAVKAFQNANKINADGIAGPETQRALGMQ